MSYIIQDINEEIQEVFKMEASRVGLRSGLEFMISQYEYEGTWKI